MKNKTLLWLIIIALIAIGGLLLMLKYSNAGMGVYISGPRAIDMLSEKRPFLGGSPEGLPVETGPRQGWQYWQGREPCPEGYRIQTAKITRKEKCLPVIQPDRYPDFICCPNIRYQ